MIDTTKDILLAIAIAAFIVVTTLYAFKALY
jgi:hypothetical protein